MISLGILFIKNIVIYYFYSINFREDKFQIYCYLPDIYIYIYKTEDYC